MATREQLHKEIDALPEGELAAARVVVESSQNNGSDPSAGRVRPYLKLSDAAFRRFARALDAPVQEMPTLRRHARKQSQIPLH